jgi:uncharacterized delta-60 repeat protein
LIDRTRTWKLRGGIGGALLGVLATLAFAAAGGAVTPPAAGTNDVARAALLEPDGDLVVIGSSSGQLALARYLPTGALDRSFGAGGRVTTDLSPGAHDVLLAAVPGADGSIVAGGTSGSRAVVVRYLPDGSLDRGFGEAGAVTLGCCEAPALAAGPNGDIVVATDGPSGSRVHRLSADGAVDTSWRATPLPLDARALAPDAEGRTLVAGPARGAAPGSLAVSRLEAGGSPDPSFGSGGTLTDALPSGATPGPVTVGPDGAVLAGGSVDGHALLARFAPDGATDPSFGTGGAVTFGPDGATVAALATGTDATWAAGAAPGGLLLGALDGAGALDPAFGTSGVALDHRLRSAAAVLAGPARLLVAGSAGAAGGSDFAVAAFQPDGSPDASFGSGGVVTTDFAAPAQPAPTPGPPDGSAGDARPHTRASAGGKGNRQVPNPVPAWYVNADNMTELKRFAAADTCAFARSQPRSAKRALLLDFGGARAYKNGNFGAAVNNASFTASNHQIRIALQVAADAYASCHKRGQATISYAVTNHFKSRFAATRARAIGVHQARTVHRLWRYQRRHGYVPAERAGVAGDIEMGYWGPKYSKKLVNGAKATWTRGYVDFGTAGGCPPHPGLSYLGHGCFDGWRLRDVAHVSNSAGGNPLPEIYYHGNPNHFDQAAQWRRVALNWNNGHATPFVFAGTTGSTQFSGMTPGQSWTRLRRKTPGHVGRELLNFKEDHWIAKRAGGG